jgi:hypothetical protein
MEVPLMAPPVLLEALFARFRPALWRYLRVLGCEPALADDLVQEVFVVVLQRPQFDGSKPGAAFAFLRTTASSCGSRAAAAGSPSARSRRAIASGTRAAATATARTTSTRSGTALPGCPSAAARCWRRPTARAPAARPAPAASG